MTCDLMGRECTGCSGGHAVCVCHRRKRRAALLINLGTPDSPAVADVRRYLREFLSDPFVIKLPGGWRRLTPALGALIAHFRAPQSAEAYRSIWWDEGSPLRVMTGRQQAALRERLGADWSVYYAMRYGNPGIGKVLGQMAADGITDVVVVPMYPQWAGPTTGTALERLYGELRRQGLRLNLSVRTEWYDDRAYLEAQAGLIHRFAGGRGLSPESSFLLFSAHSMPASYVRDGDPYEGHIRGAMELVLRLLDWPADRTALSFQSKLGPVPWLAPSTETTLAELADRGEQRVVVCPISFTADCLETLEEIDIRYARAFSERSGGGELHLVPSLNDDAAFIGALASLVRRGPRPVGIEDISPLPPARHEPLATLAERLVMVGVAVPGRLEDAAEGQFVDEPTLQNLRREGLDVLEMVRDCARLPQVEGCLILNTCQRCELYAVLARGASASEVLPRLRGRLAAGMEMDFEPMSLSGPPAHRRLLRTALGLNSKLPGDADVIEQLGSARRMAEHTSSMSTGLQRLLDEVEREASAIGAETSWADYMTEFTSAAMASLGSGAGAGDEVVIVGGSTTSRQLLRNLAADGSLNRDRLTFVYRGAARKDLVKFVRHVAPHARRLCVTRYDAPEALSAIAQADTVLLGIDSRQPVLRREHLEPLRDFRRRPLLLIDFNSFGSTDGVESLEGVRLLGARQLSEAACRHGEQVASRPGFDSAFAAACRRVDAAAGAGGGGACGDTPRWADAGAAAGISAAAIEQKEGRAPCLHCQ